MLLILAGVSINFILGKEGIFTKTQTAVETYQNAQNEEEIQIAKYSNYIDIYASNRNESINDFRENILCEYNMNSITNNSINDTSGNNINITVHGTGYQIKEENNRKYLTLDGSTYFQTEDLTSLKNSAEKTIMCCFRTNYSGR